MGQEISNKMNEAMWGAIGSLLLIIIGLWKYFTGKARAKQKRKEEGLDEAKQGIKEQDTSKITGGIDDINNS